MALCAMLIVSHQQIEVTKYLDLFRNPFLQQDMSYRYKSLGLNSLLEVASTQLMEPH